MPHRPHQLNLAGALTHKGETYLPDFIRTGPPRWNRLYALTEDGGENTIKIKMAGRELFYIPTTYWDFEKSSLKNWLSDTLIESKDLAFKMLRVKTGFNISDEDLPTLVDAPLELPNDKASNNSEDQEEHKIDTNTEDQTPDDEVTSFVPNKKRSKRPRQRSYRGQYGGYRGHGAQLPYQIRRPYRGRYRGGQQLGYSAPVQPRVRPPSNPPTAPQTTQTPFIPWPLPIMGCQGHNQPGNAFSLMNPLLNKNIRG